MLSDITSSHLSSVASEVFETAKMSWHWQLRMDLCWIPSGGSKHGKQLM